MAGILVFILWQSSHAHGPWLENPPYGDDLPIEKWIFDAHKFYVFFDERVSTWLVINVRPPATIAFSWGSHNSNVTMVYGTQITN